MAAPPAIRQRPDRALVYAALVIVAGVLATTLAQTQVLARLPLQNLLKNELHADRTANAAFFFWAGLAWYLKPFAGILTDAFPLFGSRRKSYILISATLAALSWLVLIVTPHEYRNLLFVVIVINTFMMVTSTVVGGLLHGRRLWDWFARGPPRRLTGARATRSSAITCWKIGVSRMPSRIHKPIPTMTMLSQNGTRHPQLRS